MVAARQHGLREVKKQEIDHIWRINEQGWRDETDSLWGLIPSWASDPSVGAKMHNARMETLTERQSFRGLLARHRCVVSVSGFQELRREGQRSVPVLIRREDRELMWLAGLWTTWRNPLATVITSHTIITREAAGLMAEFEGRIAVVLDHQAKERWLNPAIRSVNDVLGILAAASYDGLIVEELRRTPKPNPQMSLL